MPNLLLIAVKVMENAIDSSSKFVRSMAMLPALLPQGRSCRQECTGHWSVRLCVISRLLAPVATL